MRCLNEGIAREANREDGCKGRFWEGRFKSQALLDERALLACMAYVDLNPIRAGLSEAPECSDFTSIQERLSAFVPAEPAVTENTVVAPAPVSNEPAATTLPPSSLPPHDQSTAGDPAWLGTSTTLAAFVGSSTTSLHSGLPFEFGEYVQLVEWSGRQWRSDKRGAIPATLPSLLQRFGVSGETWMETVRHFRRGFHDHVGPVEALKQRGNALGRRWLRGVGACRRLWAQAPVPAG